MELLPLAAAILFLSGISLAVGDAAAFAADNNRPALTQASQRQSTKQTIAYGPDELQRVDYWAAARRNAPLVIFVHGGGWRRGDKEMMDGSAKLEHWQSQGYAVASVNYRLVPENTVEEEAADVATAVARLRKDARRLGFDETKIVLTGHSAGAHLVALVGTDPRYLKAEGLSLNNIAGVIPIDGAAYDVAKQISQGNRFMHDVYLQAFGEDPARQKRLSPTLHAAAPNAPEFLILHVQRRDGTEQSEALAEALRKGGTKASVRGFKGRGLRGHMQINRKLGEADYPATAVVDRWLKRVVG